jgi:hypothetical protein
MINRSRCLIFFLTRSFVLGHGKSSEVRRGKPQRILMGANEDLMSSVEKDPNQSGLRAPRAQCRGRNREETMSDFSKEATVAPVEAEAPSKRKSDLLREIFSLAASDALKRVLSLDHPEHVIRSMSRVDFFWLLRKVGEDDSVPLLQMASAEQWQHILDMELWNKDRVDLHQVSLWFARLRQADVARLARWLCGDGESFAYLYFSKNIRVEVRRGDEVYDLTEGFTTLDNVYFFKILDREHEEMITDILQHLATADYQRYQAFLLGLAGVLPAQVEEEMYRVRNVRLAEDGFLPHEEAISVYAHMERDSLKRTRNPAEADSSHEPDERIVAPLTPLIYSGGASFFVESTGRISDPILADRIRLEFAGLCNQVIAADRVVVNDLEALLKVCRKTAGFISLGLEEVSDGQLALAEEYAANNPLIALFRVGFGLAMELKWQAERWMNKAWFVRRKLERSFWGDEWAGLLTGLSEKKPRLFTQPYTEGSFKEFETLSEIIQCRIALNRMMALDRLLENMCSGQAFERQRTKDPFFTFHALIFTFWARLKLNHKPGFEPLSMSQVKALFKGLRQRETHPPYRMMNHRKLFIETLMSYASRLDGDTGRVLEETLSLLWEDFVQEYALVEETDLDGKFMRFILLPS